MKTILDKCYDFLLDNINYQNEGELTIDLTELIVSSSKIDLNVGNGKIIKDLNPVEITKESKCFRVEFKEVVFYQVVDESYCVLDNYEIRDGNDKIQVFSKSRYLDFINENFPIYVAMDKIGQHFRIITATEVIDIITYDEPLINEVTEQIQN